MYQKEKSQITVHKTAADMVRRDEANKKLAFAAGNKIKPVLKQLDTALTGLGDKAVISHRIAFGRNKTSVYKGYKQDKIEMRGDRAEMSDFPLYLNMVAGGLDRRDQTISGFSFVVKIYAVPVVEIIG